MFRFEKLDVWKKAIVFADSVYALSKQFPSDERFGLTSQIRRAAVSISSNIAEGSGRVSDNDFARFIGIAYGSVMEVVSQTFIARKQEILSDAQFKQVYEQAEELSRMLSGLRSHLTSGSRPSTLDP